MSLCVALMRNESCGLLWQVQCKCWGLLSSDDLFNKQITTISQAKALLYMVQFKGSRYWDNYVLIPGSQMVWLYLFVLEGKLQNNAQFFSWMITFFKQFYVDARGFLTMPHLQHRWQVVWMGKLSYARAFTFTRIQLNIHRRFVLGNPQLV